MKKKAILSLVLVALLAFGIGAGSFAWFTSQATSTNNLFEAGTLKIGDEIAGSTARTVETLTVSTDTLGNIFPGWTSTAKTISVENNGSLPFIYRMSVNASNSILYTGATPLQVKIDGGSWTDIDALGYVEFPQVAAGATGQFTIQFMLPTGANDDYQGAEADFTFVFDAKQVQAGAQY